MQHGSKLDSRDLYTNIREFGTDMGSAFQALRQILFDDIGHASAIVDPLSWLKSTPNAHSIHDHVIHPIALDAIFQTTTVASSAESWKAIPTMVPYEVQCCTVSNDLLNHKNTEKLEVNAFEVLAALREKKYDIQALGTDTRISRIAVKGYTAAAISGIESSLRNQFGRKRMFHQLHWEPDIDMLSAQQISAFCRSRIPAEDFVLPELIDAWEAAVQHFISVTVENFPEDQLNLSRPHLKLYYTWMKNQSCKQKSRPLIGSLDISNQQLQ
ncbi:MAG: hypothetical protein LQ340_002555 [Diploschistes diacapsis]|nr:MAG: hypothetical protein LQ340_002555 [Diploschistes diacapsis]